MKRIRKSFGVSLGFLAAFVLWTLVICFVDLEPIGPQGTMVGLAKINGFVHNFTGVHFALYHITDWLELVPLGVCLGFGALGLVQWLKRKSIFKVDRSILALGVFYIVTIAAYLLFENMVINYRPVLINGELEASYPSSTTMLVLCVMPTAVFQFRHRIRNRSVQKLVVCGIYAFVAFMVIGRFLSGVHWLSDIIGSVLFSVGLVMMYYAVVRQQN